MTAQGHPRATYRRAIERGNLLVAETVLRELGRPTLDELLEPHRPYRAERPATVPTRGRALVFRYLQEDATVSLDDLQAVVGCLAALGGPRHDDALLALRGMGEEVTTGTRRRGVA